MRKIVLTDSSVTLVDCDTFEWASRRTWKNNKGYAQQSSSHSGCKGKMLHRLILKLTDRMIEVDHIDGNRLDNRRKNLRQCSSAQNNRNKKPVGQVPFLGVTFNKRCRKYQAMATVPNGSSGCGKPVYLGLFGTAEEAAMAYDNFAREHYEGFARLNFPDKGVPQ
jgi:hypothetical protein